MFEALNLGVFQVTVFLSSPFGGMEAERAIFVEQHLPALKRMCQQRGVTLNCVGKTPCMQADIGLPVLCHSNVVP